MSEWKPYKLDEIATKLGDGLHGTPKYDDAGEYYFINGSNLVNGKIVINSNTKKVTQEEYNKYKKELSDRTILLGINGTIGNVALFNNEKCILGKSACYINVDKKFDKQFIKYILLSDGFQNYIKTNATGTTIKNVGLKLIREYEALIPSDINEQQEIASILSSLDDKIELNLQMNQTLEAMAQAIFKEWFVNFNFPGFDGELVDGLPKGWKMGKIKDVCEIKYGKDHKHLGEGKIPVYGSGGIMRFADQPIYSNHSILIPRKGTLSNLFYVSTPFWSVDTMFYTIIKSEYLQKYLFYLLKTLNLASRNVGSAVPSLTTDVLNKIEIVIPDDKTLKAFELIISSFYSKLEENNSQINSLTQIRDSILPKLMTGKIRLNTI
jgi:type I restriction enzyme S subunit